MIQPLDHPFRDPGFRTVRRGSQSIDRLPQRIEQSIALFAFVNMMPESAPVVRTEIAINLIR